jgi:hypothetical protein
MCHHVPVRLSAEEQQAVRRLTGIMIPACALLALAVVAGFALGPAPDRHEVVASVPAVDASR